VVPTSLATTLPTGATTTAKMRVSPDVSMDADPYTGFLVGQTQTLPNGTTGYGESAWGGTSLASPLFAGLQADAMQLQGYRPIGFANPAIYARYGSPVYYDVTAQSPGTKAYNDVPVKSGTGATSYSVDFGDTQILAATRGYDDVTGVGTPNPLYLWSHLLW
jgi:subtilase family serine protease